MAAYDNCPAVVRQSDPFKTKIEVTAPYENVDDNVMLVEPVADKNDPFIIEIRDAWGSHDNLTPLDGHRPLGTSTMPGWKSEVEYNERRRIRKRLLDVYQLVQGSTPASGPIHPQAKALLHALTYEGTQKLNEIREIYDRWRNRRLPSIYAGQTVGGDTGRPVAIAPDGRQPLSLHYSVDDYKTWLASMSGEERMAWVNANYWPNVTDILRHAGLTIAGPNPNSISASTFYKVLIYDQWQDRNRIRELLRDVYRILYCVEYGVAQSESFYANKAQYLAGPGGKAPPGGLAQPPPPPPGVPAGPGGLGAVLPEPPDPFEPPPPLPEPFGPPLASPGGYPPDHPCSRVAGLRAKQIQAVAMNQPQLAAALAGQIANLAAACALAVASSGDFPPDVDASSDQQDAITPDAMDLFDFGDGQIWYRTTAGKVALIAGAGVLATVTVLIVQHVRRKRKKRS